MDLLQIKKSFPFLIIWLLCWSSLMAQVQLGDTTSPSDTLQLSLRLTSHVLIGSAEILPKQIDSLQEMRVPLGILVSEKDTDMLNRLIERISERDHSVLLIFPDGVPDSYKHNKKVIALSGTEMDKVGFQTDPEVFQKKHSFRNYLWFSGNEKEIPSPDYFFRFWGLTGKLPNFIQTGKKTLPQSVEVVKDLNGRRKIFGIVRNGGQLLAGVAWKGYPGRKTNGFFSFPVDSGELVPFAPDKAGYQFSPDIILPSRENLHHLKIFNAVPLDPDFGLTDDFIFIHRVRNLKRGNDEEIINYGVDFIKDKIQGKCARFSGNAYIDGGLKSRSALKSNFSVTVWIKPTHLGDNNCILGKGKDFVLKLHKGMLTFTVQGVKDYMSEKTPIPVNQWSFVSLVQSNSDNQISFFLNGKLTETMKLLTPYTKSDNTLLIGSDLWEEFFVGDISEIKIWNRELNANEIRNEYLHRKNGTGYDPSKVIFWLFFLLVGLGLILRRWVHEKEKARMKEVNKTGNHSVSAAKETGWVHENRNQIHCFGGLQVINHDGKDVSLKFSPKLRQLFVLIFLHSVAGEKGISSKKMSDCLWPGMNQQNTKNIRGTTIQNLKALLANCSGISLVFRERLWSLEFSKDYFIDYDFVETALDHWSSSADNREFQDEFSTLTYLLKRGPLFPDIRESWLDPYVDRMSNRIIEFGMDVFQVVPEGAQDPLLLDIAEIISINDPLNEPALRKKIGILTRQGKLSLAHSVFDSFTKLYFELYKEKYPGEFKALISD